MSASVMRSGFPDSQRQKMVRLGYVVRCLDGQRVPVDAKDREPGCIPYWGAGTIQDYVADYLFDEQLVLLGEDGAPFDDARRPVAHYSAGKIWVNNHMHVLQVQSTVDAKYLSYALNCVNYSEYLSGAIIPKLTQARMMSIKLPIPPLEQQARIVAFLDEETAKIDHLIAKQRELINLTNSRLQAWREHAFWGNGHGNPLECPPEGWEVLRNRHILEHVDGRSETGDEEMLSVSHLTGVTPRSMKNVTMFEAESTVGYKLVGQNELVINTMWAWMGALGVSRYEGIVSPAYDVYKFRDLDAVNPMYFDCMYHTAAYVQLMKANSRGIWESRLRLYPEIFLRLPSLVPPKETQDYLVDENYARTTEAEGLTTQGNKAIELLQERRAALVTAVVTGHIEV